MFATDIVSNGHYSNYSTKNVKSPDADSDWWLDACGRVVLRSRNKILHSYGFVSIGFIHVACSVSISSTHTPTKEYGSGTIPVILDSMANSKWLMGVRAEFESIGVETRRHGSMFFSSLEVEPRYVSGLWIWTALVRAHRNRSLHLILVQCNYIAFFFTYKYTTCTVLMSLRARARMDTYRP